MSGKEVLGEATLTLRWGYSFLLHLTCRKSPFIPPRPSTNRSVPLKGELEKNYLKGGD